MPALSFYKPTDFDRFVRIPANQGQAEPYRSGFRRDYARILHCPAFRRLQRKTQLFPGDESDFFRNRLTHSLEVSQIAKSIAIRLNHQIKEDHGKRSGAIDTDLVELAGLAHDLGHPPFGHTGEDALHERMQGAGGFEGNAQTLRILSRLEKRETSGPKEAGFVEFLDGKDLRAGLNLCFRSLAAILKYDRCVPMMGTSKLVKGYYKSEEALVARLKDAVAGTYLSEVLDGDFQTIEMQIMDLADDIAYSTYDFEDALKAGFGSPIDLIQQLNNNSDIRDSVARKLFLAEYNRDYPHDTPSDEDADRFESIQRRMVVSIVNMLHSYLREIDLQVFPPSGSDIQLNTKAERHDFILRFAVLAQKWSDETARNGYVRSQFTSDLIGRRIRAASIKVNLSCPALSMLEVDPETRFQIDVLKHLTFELHIKSPRLKLIEYRGRQIVRELFDCFFADLKGELLPQDWRLRAASIKNAPEKEEMRARLVCDYIAGMTDAYALDVYSRLKTTNPAALFRPI